MVCNGLWDKERGVFRNYEEPKGDKQLHYVKKKLMDDVLPALGKKYDLDVNNNINPLPLFVMVKNIQDSYIYML